MLRIQMKGVGALTGASLGSWGGGERKQQQGEGTGGSVYGGGRKLKKRKSGEEMAEEGLTALALETDLLQLRPLLAM